MVRKMRLALPNKGRLVKPCLNLLNEIGIELLGEDRAYIRPTTSPNIEVIFARAFDIPVYVEYGCVDLGITGQDLVMERSANVFNLHTLNFGTCKMVVAVPKNSPINTISDMQQTIRVSTEFPNISEKYFQSLGKQVEVLEVRGATELAPLLGLSEVIVDITSTGETLKKNNLKIISTIMDSSSSLIGNKLSYRLFEKEITSILDRLGKIGGVEN